MNRENDVTSSRVALARSEPALSVVACFVARSQFFLRAASLLGVQLAVCRSAVSGWRAPRARSACICAHTYASRALVASCIPGWPRPRGLFTSNNACDLGLFVWL